ncbi:hypothetical protein FMEXI_8436 [Fusarium mexicanum]|uniref:Uncharacterized protein n=1 Tax=Fusarium mexicanum TaxID=751941 RepID=A0A8H5IR44_9HYPO|nr:hypothetical protein FMEXI_8436 [Fusarium mexicanum]
MANKEEVARFCRTQLYKDIELALHNLLTKKRDAISPPHHRPLNTTTLPSVGRPTDMEFKICQRDHPDGEACADRVCFIPNASARKYMLGFMADPRQNRSLDGLEPVAYCLVRKYGSNIPSKDIEAFSSIVRMLFLDLRYADRQNWDPEVHGVLDWKHLPFETWVKEFMTEIHRVRWKRDMKEYL